MAKEQVIDIDLDIEDLDLEDATLVEVDPIEEEIKAAAKPKKEKKTKKESTGEGLASTKALAEDEVGAGYVAELCGVDSRELRMFLRKHYRNMETEKSTRYIWKKGDPKIQEIVDAFKAHKSAPRVKAKKEEVTEDAE